MGWKEPVVEKVSVEAQYLTSSPMSSLPIAKVINVERDTALELWVGNSARMMGPTTEHNS